jgi:trehalose synthase
VAGYDASIFSMCQFAQTLPHPQYLIPPSIDPLSPKNIDLDPEELSAVRYQYNLDSQKPLLVQISRFDRFKDPLGVIAAYKLVRKSQPVQLVLAGGGASDDPEGQQVLDEALEAAAGDPDIHILLLPSDAHKTINALQRLASIVIQKSTREGFGLTVTEGLWKGKPVIGGDTGGIRLQLVNYHTGFLVNTPEGAAHRIRFLLHHEKLRNVMGIKAREFVRENFLLTRQLREYLTLFHIVSSNDGSSTIFI